MSERMTETERLSEIDRIVDQLSEAETFNKLSAFEPSIKQREFIALGKRYPERAIIAANRSGKSYVCCWEVACHLTGQYRPDWQGRKFSQPVKAWAAGMNALAVRESIQTHLLGPEPFGTGLIPKSALVDGGIRMSRGVGGVVDSARVRHVSGGESTLVFRSYDQTRDAWMGSEVHVMFFDEQPPMDLYIEGYTRTTTCKGICMASFTPLKGAGDVVALFQDDPSPHRAYVNMTLDDAPFLSAEEKARMIASWPAHELEARSRGIPYLGTGKVYQVPESSLEFDYRGLDNMPNFLHHVGAIDFGTQKMGWALGAWDKDTDVLYIVDARVMSGASLFEQVAMIKAAAPFNVPIAFPHDGGGVGDRISMKPVAQLYREQGLDMQGPVQFADKSNSVEAGIQILDQRMRRGGLKVARHLQDFWKEYRSYARDDNGRVKKQNDHVLDAVRYLVMGLKYARTMDAIRDRATRRARSRAGGVAMAKGLMMDGL